MASSDVTLDDITRDRYNLGPSCTICPSNLSQPQHQSIHPLLVKVRILINKHLNYDPYKPRSLAYKFKQEEIFIAHDLGFCTTDQQCKDIQRRLKILIDDIRKHVNDKTVESKLQQLRI